MRLYLEMLCVLLVQIKFIIYKYILNKPSKLLIYIRYIGENEIISTFGCILCSRMFYFNSSLSSILRTIAKGHETSTSRSRSSPNTIHVSPRSESPVSRFDSRTLSECSSRGDSSSRMRSAR